MWAFGGDTDSVVAAGVPEGFVGAARAGPLRAFRGGTPFALLRRRVAAPR